MDVYLSTIYRLLQVLVVLGISVSLTTPAHAQAIDETPVGQQLRELKELCDDGLVNPDVCKEKQREILGLEVKNIKKDMATSAAAAGQSVLEPRTTDYYDPLGFHIKLPDGWDVRELNITSDDLEKLKDRHPDDLGTSNVLRYMESKLRSGTMRILENGKAIINIRKNRVALPSNSSVSQQVCESIASRLSSSSNGPQAMYECKLGKVGESLAFYVNHDSRVNGMRTIQYWIENPNGETYMFQLDCDNANLETRQKEFDKIIASVNWE